jgi:hypothetical protein
LTIVGWTSATDSQFETALRRTRTAAASCACEMPARRRARRIRSFIFIAAFRIDSENGSQQIWLQVVHSCWQKFPLQGISADERQFDSNNGTPAGFNAYEFMDDRGAGRIGPRDGPFGERKDEAVAHGREPDGAKRS